MVLEPQSLQPSFYFVLSWISETFEITKFSIKKVKNWHALPFHVVVVLISVEVEEEELAASMNLVEVVQELWIQFVLWRLLYYHLWLLSFHLLALHPRKYIFYSHLRIQLLKPETYRFFLFMSFRFFIKISRLLFRIWFSCTLLITTLRFFLSFRSWMFCISKIWWCSTNLRCGL